VNLRNAQMRSRHIAGADKVAGRCRPEVFRAGGFFPERPAFAQIRHDASLEGRIGGDGSEYIVCEGSQV